MKEIVFTRTVPLTQPSEIRRGDGEETAQKKRPLQERPEFREETPERACSNVCCDAQYDPG